MIHCAVFDMDGTLIDSQADLINTCNEFRRIKNLPEQPPEQIITYVGDGIRKLLSRTLADTKLEITEEIFAEFMQCYLWNLNVRTTLYPGVKEGLKRLWNAGWKLAVFSNKRQDFCEQILTRFQVIDLFSIIIGDGSPLPKKPDPAALKYILDTLHAADSRQSWMVGDHHTDLNAGTGANMKTAFCEYGFGKDGGIEPDLRIHSFKEFTDHVL